MYVHVYEEGAILYERGHKTLNVHVWKHQSYGWSEDKTSVTWRTNTIIQLISKMQKFWTKRNKTI